MQIFQNIRASYSAVSRTGQTWSESSLSAHFSLAACISGEYCKHAAKSKCKIKIRTKLRLWGSASKTWQNKALDLLQDKTVWLGTRRSVVGFKCIIGVSVENWQELYICYYQTGDAFDSDSWELWLLW